MKNKQRERTIAYLEKLTIKAKSGKPLTHKEVLKHYRLMLKGITKKKRKGLSVGLRFRILKECNFTCQYCGKKAPEAELHVDHIIPHSKGGTDKDSNLVASCIDCNLGKNDIVLGNSKALGNG